MKMNMKSALLVFLALNALFWGFASHSQHCKLVSMLGVSNCPPHWVHLLMGICFYFGGIGVSQRSYLNYLYKKGI